MARLLNVSACRFLWPPDLAKFGVHILGRPLSDSKTLKDKFDQIFDATRYVYSRTLFD
jgi:hypothetical protein